VDGWRRRANDDRPTTNDGEPAANDRP